MNADRFARIEDQRKLRLRYRASEICNRVDDLSSPAPLDGSLWAIVKVNDDGREFVTETCRSMTEAERFAGKHRDTMSERDVELGWNYIARRLKSVGVNNIRAAGGVYQPMRGHDEDRGSARTRGMVPSEVGQVDAGQVTPVRTCGDRTPRSTPYGGAAPRGTDNRREGIAASLRRPLPDTRPEPDQRSS